MKPRVICILLFGMCLMQVMSCTKAVIVPSDLIGIWVTEAPMFEDRYIEVNETEIIFGMETGASTFFFIKKISEKKIGEFVEWSFQCKTGDSVPVDIVLFFLNSEDGAHFELRNQRQIKWVRSQG